MLGPRKIALLHLRQLPTQIERQREADEIARFRFLQSRPQTLQRSGQQGVDAGRLATAQQAVKSAVGRPNVADQRRAFT